MYEMRAGPATTSSPGPVWHVMAERDGCTTLCGRNLAAGDPLTSIRQDALTERYCSLCMTAVQEILQVQKS
ncbi:hypothetical protein ACQUSR_03915 [Streptomyces sp. P1-3]|uniref:hypothetical protein n=1 Tax=Streptomyces sp. P1-3 TaxID=3421658 RepID=UPI003D36DF0C